MSPLSQRLSALIAAAGLVCALNISSTANAQEGAPAAAPQAAPKLITGGKFALIGGVSTEPLVLFGFTPADDILIGVGGLLSVDFNGFRDPATGAVSEDNVSLGVALAAQWMMYNVAPFAFGPELIVAAIRTPLDNLTADAFGVLSIQPGLGLWVAPFPAPLLLGAYASAQFNIIFKAKSTIDLLNGGVRLAYVFP